MMNGNSFVEIAAILGLATLTGIVGQKLRQPLIIMFLATGILAGPSFLGIIHSYEQIELLAHMGIALLLFIVGLKLDLNLIRTTGPVALATGLGQIVFTSLIGFVIAMAMDMSFLTAAYVSVALTTLGSSVSQEGPAYLSVVLIGTKGLGMLVIVGLLMRYVIPYLVNRLAHSLELLPLFAIAWAVLLGAGSEILGFSKEVGAFLAGLTVAQISEFSLIVAALKLSIGHITEQTMGLITLVGVVTIFLSTYMILYSYPLYRFLSGPLKIFERRHPYREAAIDTLKKTQQIDVILVGLGKYGSGLGEYLLRRGKAILGVDFDPGALDRWRKKGVPVLYGDMADPEMHEHLPLNTAGWVIITVRSKDRKSRCDNNP